MYWKKYYGSLVSSHDYDKNTRKYRIQKLLYCNNPKESSYYKIVNELLFQYSTTKKNYK